MFNIFWETVPNHSFEETRELELVSNENSHLGKYVRNNFFDREILAC